MSGDWIKLNDTHVRVDHTHGQRQYPWTVAEALFNLYDVEQKPLVPGDDGYTDPDWDLLDDPWEKDYD